MINLIIFSKNRAMQLDGLLRSIEQNCDIFDRINILYKATTPDHKKAYNILANKHGSCFFIKEENFKKDTESLICYNGFFSYNHTCFLVDDCIAHRKIKEIEKLYLFKTLKFKDIIFSLRLGLDQKNAPRIMIQFDWSQEKGDWNYPLSVDGHIFRTAYIDSLIKRIYFINPNKLEAGLQKFKEDAPPFMACFNESMVVSIPVNKVSDTSGCSSGDKYSYSVEYLNKLFLEGKRLDYENMDFSNIRGCHQEIKFEFK